MIAPRLLTWRFVNRYGEEWEFVYDSGTGEGVLRGADVAWQDCPVVGGRALGLVLNDEEIAWLRKACAEATSESKVVRGNDQGGSSVEPCG
jgi:hypothetical protein